jgi:hypothetical protein
MGGTPAEFQTPDGMINETSALLDNVSAYSYGPNNNRPSTQTSYVNHPHRIQKIIPKMFLPCARGDSGLPDIALEHALHDGDLTFTIRMPKEMICGPSEFCHARNLPGKTLAQLVNLATINYLLWGLQVGRHSPNTRNNRWQDFFLRLTQGQLHFQKTVVEELQVWQFLQTYLRPFGVMVGSDMQGGQHEGGGNNNVATFPVDYVASFLIDGKCIKLNNLWRHHSIAAGDDVVLVLKKTTYAERNLVHVLTSGSRAFREERTSSDTDWFYLAPAISTPAIHDSPFIHIGRAQAMYSSYHAGMGMGKSPWDARASILGAGIQVTFAPTFCTPDRFAYPSRDGPAMAGGDLPPSDDGAGGPLLGVAAELLVDAASGAPAAAVVQPPPKKTKRIKIAGLSSGPGGDGSAAAPLPPAAEDEGGVQAA